jgi:hypothetical protein
MHMTLYPNAWEDILLKNFGFAITYFIIYFKVRSLTLLAFAV